MHNICHCVRQDKSTDNQMWLSVDSCFRISSKLCEPREPLMEERKSGAKDTEQRKGAGARDKERDCLRGLLKLK